VTIPELDPAPPADHSRPLLARSVGRGSPLLWVAAALLLAVIVAWAWLTPPGLLGKADAVGYAVCHRITLRSFLFPDGRQLPMCARCSGTFLGVLVGLLGPGLLLGRRRAAAFPPAVIMAIMLGMSALWAFDGANSFLTLIPSDKLPRLYEPTNFLRLLTGMFHGITMGGLVLPVANSVLWADPADRPVIEKWWHLALLYGAGALLIVMLLSGLAVFLYPLALLSAVGTVSVLAAINVVMVTSIMRRENAARTLADALPLILLGLALAFVLIGGIDALRYAMFRTWDGFVFPPSP
jgi:uncharacterized membrane protein